MNIEKELFELFQSKKNDFDLYNETVKLIAKVLYKTKGEENAKFYSVLSKLSNSINNAGHEKRRTDDILFVNQSQSEISKNYDEFLP